MTKEHNLAPCVAAYALFSTEFAGIDAAMDFIFEKSQNDDEANREAKLQHIYVAYVPEGAEDLEESKALPYLNDKTADSEELKDELGDLELGDSNVLRNEYGPLEVCFICQNPASQHDPARQASLSEDRQMLRSDSDQLLAAASDKNVDNLQR